MAYFGNGGRDGSSEAGPEAGKFAMLAEVRAYWEGLRHGGALPRRDEIDPRGIAGALENTFLLERVAPGIARFRLAGMQLHDLMGMDVRGMPLSSLIEPPGRIRLAEALEGVLTGPATLEIRLEAERGIGRPAMEGRMLLLPLTAARGDTDLVLGCLALHGSVGRVPRRFAIAGMVSEKIERRTAAGRRAEDHAPQPVPGLAEAGGHFTPTAPRPPRGKPNLRLVHSRD
jgi:hypothetical protein